MIAPMPPKLQALQRWERVARKDLDPELVDWLAVVARGLLEAAAEKDANRRRQATLDATGLRGRASMISYLAHLVATESAALVDPKTRVTATKVMVGLTIGHVPGTKEQLSEEAMRKRVERARKRKY